MLPFTSSVTWSGSGPAGKEARGGGIRSAWRSRVRLVRTVAGHPRFGDAVIVLFLLAQAADGVMTYVGVTTLGIHLEANPLLASLMNAFGEGTAVAAAKLVASGLGISLHLIGVHGILAVLTGIYLLAAVLPWAGLLLFV
jgi:uncharacterized membrane protein